MKRRLDLGTAIQHVRYPFLTRLTGYYKVIVSHGPYGRQFFFFVKVSCSLEHNVVHPDLCRFLDLQFNIPFYPMI